MNKQKILVLAPHTDDGELGCGGTVAKLIEDGYEVFYAVFSTCEESVPAGFPKDTLKKELNEALQVLGISEDHLTVFHYPVRRFHDYRQDILDDMIVLRNTLHPDLIFMPGSGDIHQDHQVIFSEGLRAFKYSSILCYEFAWNNLTVHSSAFVRLEKRHLRKKTAALSKYYSQHGLRNYVESSYIEGLAIVNGVQINTEYAEAFNVLRCVL